MNTDFLLSLRRLEISLLDFFRYSSSVFEGGSVEGGYHYLLLLGDINGAADQLNIFAAFDIMELKVFFGSYKHSTMGVLRSVIAMYVVA